MPPASILDGRASATAIYGGPGNDGPPFVTGVQRLLQRWGAPAQPRRALTLTGAVVFAALAASAAGLAVAVASADALPPLARIALAALAASVAMLAGLRVRVAAGTSTACWGEAALVVGLYLVPAGWLPAATLAGAGVAAILLSVFLGRAPVDVLHLAASVTTAVAVSSAVAAGLGGVFDRPPTPRVAAVLLVSAIAYLLTTAGLAAATINLRHGSPFGVVLFGQLRAKALMFVGNVLVGLAAVASIQYQPAWLLLLPPVAWLLQQTYLHRLRAADERRAWRRLSAAVTALTTLDEHKLAVAGVAGALDAMGAERVDLDIAHADGGHRRYRAEAGRPVVTQPEPSHQREPRTDHDLHRSLAVDGLALGELRVRLSRSAASAPRDEELLSAYADALAVALHNATNHRELRVLTERSAYEAEHDPLTNLLNRRAMVRAGDGMLRNLPPERQVALVVLDIDRFKEVNDTLGHAAGDELLAMTAKRLARLGQPHELVGRLGADEFALLTAALPEPSEGDADDQAFLTAAMARAQSLVEALSRPAEVAGVTMAVEVSAGVAVAPAGYADVEELVRRAGLAVSAAKQRAGNVAAYDSGQDAGTADQLVLLAELREALAADDQLVLALQPAVDLVTGAPAGVEALVRWQHPRRGTLHPAEFIRAAEASDVHRQLTRYVVDRALQSAARWAAEGLAVPVSVNVSARSLLDPRLPTDIAELLRRHGVPPDQLVVEITETVAMSELSVIDEVLAALQEIGVQLAVDDFGTGFSSLAFLARIRVDELKIDRSFVIAMIESTAAAAIVRATLELGRGLGLRVVAEGVETAEQRAALTDLGCSAAQGYLFFKPLPEDKITPVLRSLVDAAQTARVLPLRADGAS